MKRETHDGVSATTTAALERSSASRSAVPPSIHPIQEKPTIIVSTPPMTTPQTAGFEPRYVQLHEMSPGSGEEGSPPAQLECRPSATCIHPSRERGRSYDLRVDPPAPVRGDEHAAAAGVKRGHRVELGADLAELRGSQAGQGACSFWRIDPYPDLLPRVVRRARTAGGRSSRSTRRTEQLPELILLGFTGMG